MNTEQAERIYSELVACGKLDTFIDNIIESQRFLGDALEMLEEEAEPSIELPELEKAWTMMEVNLRPILMIKLRKEKEAKVEE